MYNLNYVFYQTVIRPKDADQMEYNADPDQTAPSGLH